jgi:S1-C subfamily serine protease
VLDADGRVLALAGATAAAAGEDVPLLPAATARRIASELLRNGTPSGNAFGIVAEDLTPRLAGRLGVDRDRGAVVSIIRPGSPAAHAGMKAGDIVLSVSSAPVSAASELGRALDTDERSVTIELLRRTRRLTLVLERGRQR